MKYEYFVDKEDIEEELLYEMTFKEVLFTLLLHIVSATAFLFIATQIIKFIYKLIRLVF